MGSFRVDFPPAWTFPKFKKKASIMPAGLGSGGALGRVCMLGLGASSLAPWLAYVSAADFFISAYPEANLM